MTVDELTLNKLIKLSNKHGINILCSQLANLPHQNKLQVGFSNYRIPEDVIEFSANLTWGQRLYMATPQSTDIDSFLYITACYLQGLKGFDERKTVRLFRKLRGVKLKELYPITYHLATLFSELIKNESEKLTRPKDKKALAADVEKLDVFADFQVLEYLANRCKFTSDSKMTHIDRALTMPYDLALTMLWEKKESEQFNERYTEILKA